MKSVASGDRLVANINEAEFKPWVCEDGSVDHSQTVLQLNTARPFGVGFHLYRMAPGTTTAAHRHTGDEEFFVLDGDLTDNDGTEYHPGDLVLMKKGTEHNSTTKNGCTLVVYIEQAEKELPESAR
jgi:quercetin dioxygenase-like cupin family protein